MQEQTEFDKKMLVGGLWDYLPPLNLTRNVMFCKDESQDLHVTVIERLNSERGEISEFFIRL